MPGLFVLGTMIGMTWLSIPVFLIALPLSRLVIGGDSKKRTYPERVARILEILPMSYVPVLMGCLVWYGWKLPTPSGGAVLWAALVVVVFGGICVAHSMVHHVDERVSKLGYFLSGMLGYPWFGSEHLHHHVMAPNSDVPEVPRADETVYGWNMRRWAYILANFREFESGLSKRRLSGESFMKYGWLGTLTGVVLVASGSWMAAGADARIAVWAVGSYLLSGVVLQWLVHAVNYLQHWGLTEKEIEPGKRGPAAWQDSCVAQRWLTLELSMHYEHHMKHQAPYYEAGMVERGPRAPAGYMVLLMVSLVPPLWFKMMGPVLQAWLADPQNARSTDDRLLYCFSRLSGSQKAS